MFCGEVCGGFIDDQTGYRERQEQLACNATKMAPPLFGLSKVTVDAALAKNSNYSAAVAVARDAARNFLGASALILKRSNQCRSG